MSLQRPSIRYGTRVLLGMVLLLLLASPILASPLQQGCATMTFIPITVLDDVERGDVVILQVHLDADGVTFDVAGFLINFDQTFLQVVDVAGDPASQVEEGDLPGINWVNTALNAAGTIDFAQAIVGGQAGGTFTVATIHFKVITTLAAGSTQVEFEGVERGDTGVFSAGTNLLCEDPDPEPATITLLPVPVGGYLMPVNKLELLAPWMGLVALASLAALTVVLVRRRGG